MCDVSGRFPIGRMHHQVVVLVEMVPGDHRVTHAVAGRCGGVGGTHAHRVEQMLLLIGLGYRLLLRRWVLVLIAW